MCTKTLETLKFCINAVLNGNSDYLHACVLSLIRYTTSAPQAFRFLLGQSSASEADFCESRSFYSKSPCHLMNPTRVGPNFSTPRKSARAYVPLQSWSPRVTTVARLFLRMAHLKGYIRLWCPSHLCQLLQDASPSSETTTLYATCIL